MRKITQKQYIRHFFTIVAVLCTLRFTLWSVERKVQSVECGVRSVERKAQSVECGAQNIECGVWSEECGVELYSLFSE